MPFVKKNRGRGRCKNCNKSYVKCQTSQKFCGKDCKDEFHNAGGMSFGRLAKLIEVRVAKEVKKETKRQLSIELARLTDRLDGNAGLALLTRLESVISEFRRELGGADA